MKRIFLSLVTILFMATIATAAWAEPPEEEKRLAEENEALDTEGSSSEGEKVVVERLEKEFNVDEARIKSLRDQKLGYGEITIVLSLAQKMPGGINDANVNTLMSMRQGPPVEGWGVIAKKLGFKLGPVISTVEKVKKDSRREIEKSGRAKGEKREGRERLEKPERIVKPERPERPERRGR